MIALLIGLVVLGVVLFLLQQIPMDPAIVTVIRVVVILIAIVLVLQAFGLIHTGLRIPS